MTQPVPKVYDDDVDAFWDFTVTSSNGAVLDWTPVNVALGTGPYTRAATWQGDPGTERTLRVPFSGVAAGTHHVHLDVPGGTNFELGVVNVVKRK